MVEKYLKLFILSSAIIVVASNAAYAGGLSSHFVEAKIKGASVGKTYSVKKIIGRALDITNTTDAATFNIAIEPEKPADYNLVKGYEPIPDVSWVVVEDNHFENVKPKETVSTDVFISIPDDKKYAGKKYQVYIYSHTTEKNTFRIGIMSRVLIDTAED